jgi:hypothetical protein
MMLIFKASLCLKAFFTLLNCVFLYMNKELARFEFEKQNLILKKIKCKSTYFWTKLGPNWVTYIIFPEIF